MRHSIKDIATALGAEAAGDLDLRVAGAAEPQAAGPDQLALAMDPRYADGIARGEAGGRAVARGGLAGDGAEAAIFAPRGRWPWRADPADGPGPDVAPGIHPMAIIDPSAEIGEGAAIAPFVTVGRGVRIGRGARIASHVSIAEGACIGDAALILQGAHRRPRHHRRPASSAPAGGGDRLGRVLVRHAREIGGRGNPRDAWNPGRNRPKAGPEDTFTWRRNHRGRCGNRRECLYRSRHGPRPLR